MKKFGIVGLGFVAPRHIQAIKDVNGDIVFGCDIDAGTKEKIPQSSAFYKDFSEALKKTENLDYLSICTPNYLHYPMAVAAWEKYGKNCTIICEKPVCIRPEDFEDLLKREQEGYKLFVTQQFRHNPYLVEQQQRYSDDKKQHRAEINILVWRDDWYFEPDCWKVDKDRSGGAIINISVHAHDLLCWFFGPHLSCYSEEEVRHASGKIEFHNAFVNWNLNLRQPKNEQRREITIDGETLNLSKGFENLHTKVYQDIVFQNQGLRPSDIRDTMRLMWDLCNL